MVVKELKERKRHYFCKETKSTKKYPKIIWGNRGAVIADFCILRGGTLETNPVNSEVLSVTKFWAIQANMNPERFNRLHELYI